MCVHEDTVVEKTIESAPSLSAGQLANLRREQRFKVNQAVKVAVLGSSESLFPGRIADLSKSGMRLILDRFLQPGVAVKIEWHGHLALGSVCYCQKHGPSYAAGLQLFSSWETLTEEVLAREAAELARSNAELEQFVYVASHDLKEPLRMITSYLDLLQRRYKGKLDTDADEFIGFAVEGATRMQNLVSDLLAYSRASRGNVEMQRTDCEAAFGRAAANLSAAIKESAAALTHDRLPTVTANQSQLVQVFQNLIGNAIKFRSAAPPRVHVAAEKSEEEWVFSVRDNGIGIDKLFSQRIFKMFERLHSQTEYPGTGIGLTISKQIVERHGGRIWVESQPRRGSVFFFTIPMRGWCS
jgi:signal transduction histidine kinase